MRYKSAKMNIVIRTDVSSRIGTGHLRRCIALGSRLSKLGGTIHFLARGDRPDWSVEAGRFAEAYVELKSRLRGREDAAHTAAYCRRVAADRVIVDHLHADEAYQRVLLDAGLRWMQFDGAAATPMWADWVVSMSPATDAKIYRALRRRPRSRLLLGPRYAVVRDEFRRLRSPRHIGSPVRRLLMTFGGGDDRGATLFCLGHLPGAGTLDVTILASSYGRQTGPIRRWLRSHPAVCATLLVDHHHVAERMAEADVAITAGGTTTFEAAMLGLPSLVIQIAGNQRGNAEAWARMGVAVNLGPLANLKGGALRRELAGLSVDHARRRKMARAGQRAVDGRGVERLAEELFA